MEYNIGEKTLGPGQEMAQVYVPKVPVFLKDVKLTPENEFLDITMVMVANVMVMRWSKKEHIIYPEQGLHVIVKNHGNKDIKFDVIIVMKEVERGKN
jgi:hypothetical protein